MFIFIELSSAPLYIILHWSKYRLKLKEVREVIKATTLSKSSPGSFL